MRDLARKEIAIAMWRWTADAVDTRHNVVKQDAYKYNIEHHPATSDAIELKRIGGTANLRHEHAVPRVWLARHIINDDLSVEEIQLLLERYCVAVIVTKEEDRRLQPRNDMPPGWSHLTGNPYARYLTSGLLGSVQNIPSQWRTDHQSL